MFKNLLLVSVIALVAIGCVSAKATLLNPDVRFDPVPWQDVRVYYDEADVKGEFETIAIIRSEGKEVFTTEAQMLKKMRKKAGALGANGVILKGIKDPGDLERMADEVSGGLGLGSRKIQAIAIRVK
jgi:hypothetical protein